MKRIRTNMLWPSLLAAALIASTAFPMIQREQEGPAPRLESLIDFAGLDREGRNWRILYQDFEPARGHLKLSQSMWLMYFLHWRPLTEANKTISVAFVRNHLLNFWGQAMNFKLTDIDGTMEVCGHKAWFTEGSFGNGAVYTRFIVWNCPETNRQFTADCNINLRRKTPKELLELQRTITRTVCCHRGASPPDAPADLTQKYASEKWNVSFFIPRSWRTADYVSREWYPHGMSAQNGSLWTLPTDSVKRLDLIWENDEGGLSSDAFNRFLEKCAAPFTFENVISRMINWKLKNCREKGGVWAGEGLYEYHQETQNQEVISPYRFKGFLWREEKKVYFLLASLIQLKEFWDIPNDLTPSDETFERFIGEEILPNVKIVPAAVSNKVDNRFF